MRWQCAECGPDVPYGDEDVICPRHFRELAPYRPAPEPDAEEHADEEPRQQQAAEQADAVRWDRSKCWYCETVPSDPRNTDCLVCHRSLTPPALLLRFQNDEIEVHPGTQVDLGRVGDHGRVFQHFTNVSRRHATVGVDPDGRAWIQPFPTPNGTFVDGTEIPASVRQPLRNGQRLRFALHAEGTATVYAVRTQRQ